MYKYIGAMHIHSKYSDGSEDISFIAKAAKKAGLDWIIITDHNTLAAIGDEGFYDGVCVIGAYEITPRTSNHLLAFDTNELVSQDIGERNYIDEVHNKGGFCVVAHPDESIHRKNKQPPLRWNDWSIDSFDGLEIWNYLSDWTDNFDDSKSRILQNIFRHNMAKGPSKNVLAWWDRLNNKKENIIFATGGLDAHRFLMKKKLKIYSKVSDYEDYFKSLNDVVFLKEKLSDDFNTAKSQILNAIKNANFMLCNRRITRNYNIEFYAENRETRAFCGENFKKDMFSKIVLRLPKKATVRLIHNGLLVHEFDTSILEFDKPELGKYRVEVYYKGHPWIFTNPIKIA